VNVDTVISTVALTYQSSTRLYCLSREDAISLNELVETRAK
jgi:hypothetical protein